MASSDALGPAQGLAAPRLAVHNVPHPWIRAILDADLSQTTKDQYMRNLSVLQKLSDRRPLEDLIKYPRAAYARIETAYSNNQTKKAMVSAIKGLFKHVPGLKETYPAALEDWNVKFKALDKLIFDQVASAQPSDRERENWVPWNDVVAKERELAQTRYASSEHLMLAMYTLIEPLRADFGVLKIVEKMPPATEGTGNYLVMQPNGIGHLILNSYKTSKKYGRFEREIPDALMNVVRASLSNQPRAYLFVDEHDKPYIKKNSYIRYANRIFAKIFGKNFTIRLLRHAFVSNLNFNASTPATLIGHSKMMLHSVGMQQMYRRHVGPDSPDALPPPLPPHAQTQAQGQAQGFKYAPLPPPPGPPPGPPPVYYHQPTWQQQQYTQQQYTHSPYQDRPPHITHHKSSNAPHRRRNRNRSSRSDQAPNAPPIAAPKAPNAKAPKTPKAPNDGGRYVYV